MRKSNSGPLWKDILPEDAPRMYIGDRWKTHDEWVKENNRVFTSPCRKIVCVLFTSQYLNITSKEKYDLFSIEVLVFDNMVMLKEMHLLKLNVGQPTLTEIAQYAMKNPYLKSKDKSKMYYLGEVNNYNSLTRNVLQITRGHSALFTLGDDWIVKDIIGGVSSPNKFRGWPQR